jgi:tetratricopeptide (TPR) repeat protein
MMATPISRVCRDSLAVTILVVLMPGVLSIEAADTPSAASPAFVARAENAYQAERKRHRESPDDPEAAWRFAKACFDRAEFAEDDDRRATLGAEGIAACRRLVQNQPKLAAGHYYLALNLSQLARTKTLGALRIVKEMEVEFLRARDLDSKIDFGGPDRSIGLLYFDAPGWPVSIGSRAKARAHLQRAVDLAPDYPDNRLSFIEALVRWGDKKALAKELPEYARRMAQAREALAGEAWESAWHDWDKRWADIRKKTRFEPSAK